MSTRPIESTQSAPARPNRLEEVLKAGMEHRARTGAADVSSVGGAFLPGSAKKAGKAVASSVVDEILGEKAAPELPTRYSSTHLEDGMLSDDKTLFAFGGVFQPTPIVHGQLAVVLDEDVQDKTEAEINAASTSWLPEGFAVGGFVTSRKKTQMIWTEKEA